jgi:tetratricopeptide (TPR) repeat protein
MRLTILTTCFLLLIHAGYQNDKYIQAQRLYGKQHYKEAEALCKAEIPKLRKSDPLLIKFLELRSTCYSESGDYKTAIPDYKTLITIRPKDTYYLALGYLYAQLKDYTNVLDIMNKAIALYPKNVPLLSNFSYFNNEIGRFDDGLKYAEAGLALTTDPMQTATLLNNKGYAYLGNKRFADGITEINKAIKLNPKNPFSYFFRAVANIGLKNMVSVCGDLNKSKSLGGASLTGELLKHYCKN